MYVSRLALDHYRSWRQCIVDFEPGINILQGRNGVGKTNIVEAIEVLSTGSSHRVSGTRALIERGQQNATIRANVSDALEAEHVSTYEVTLAARGANRARVNDGTAQYLRDMVGHVPSIVFAPEDQRLVSGEPAVRRGFLDQAGTLLIPGYAADAQSFARIAKQRTALLKQLSEGTYDEHGAVISGLETWTGQFVQAGLSLTRMRLKLFEALEPRFSHIYDELAGSHQHAKISYRPSFEEIYGEADPSETISRHFQRIYPGELARGQNLIGPQRDDFELLLDGVPAREYASNGELWTMAIALKMALFQQLCESGDVKPIVILDDVFAQLDEMRRMQILEFAIAQDQVIITAAAQRDIPTSGNVHLVDVTALREHSADDSASDDPSIDIAALLGKRLENTV